MKKLRIIFDLYRKQYKSVKLFKFERYFVLKVNGLEKVFRNQTLLLIYLERGL